eukprot:COSAG06_NODE_28994_length_564_cov_0.911828_2_plen_113_part_00
MHFILWSRATLPVSGASTGLSQRQRDACAHATAQACQTACKLHGRRAEDRDHGWWPLRGCWLRLATRLASCTALLAAGLLLQQLADRAAARAEQLRTQRPWRPSRWKFSPHF